MAPDSDRAEALNRAIDEKVAFLRSPNSYATHPHRVDVIETHMSWVFLADSDVYKLKKPVRYPFLDFSTADARHNDALAELRLNRRLAEDVYLGVVALTIDDKGQWALGGDGQPVDWLVHMRRLPEEAMLDFAIRHGSLEPREIEQFGDRMTEFYRQLPAEPISVEAYRGRLISDLERDTAALAKRSGVFSSREIDRIRSAVERVFAVRPGLLDTRVKTKRIIEGHGDLRPEHVCLRPVPMVIDCLEFNRAFRIIDPIDELAFLAMECEWLGVPLVGEAVLETYVTRAGDTPGTGLVPLYKCIRACLRARLSIDHLNDDGRPDREKWIQRAQDYLALASGYAGELNAL